MANVTGLAQYKARLAAMVAALDDAALLECLQAGADIIEAELEARAPRGSEPHHVGKEFVQPGYLRSQIRVRPVRVDEHRARLDITFGRAFYWRMLEYGTARMSARPFVRPAIEAKGEEARAAIGQAILAKVLQAAR